MTMRVLHLIARFGGGGPERSVVAAARYARDLGLRQAHTVACIASAPSPMMRLLAASAGVEVRSGVGAADLATLVGTADIVQVHAWNTPALTNLLRGSALPATRTIVWCHVRGDSAPQVITTPIATFGDRLLLTSTASRRVPAVQRAMAAGVPVEVLPAFADMTRLDVVESSGREPRVGTPLVVGYLGTTNETKMHPRFVELCGAIRRAAPDLDLRFRVWGGGGGTDRLREQVRVAGLDDVVEVLGPVEHVAAVLAELDVFGYPLHPENSATSEKALQEAMWLGVPPVVLDSPSMAELIDHEATGLIAADEAQYVMAVVRLARDAELRARLGVAARQFARLAFDPIPIVRRLDDVMRELLEQPARSPVWAGRTDGPPAAWFVESLGHLADDFGRSLGGTDVASADARIAASAEVLAAGEGGIVHHRNAFPDDPHLCWWSALVAAGAGHHEVAAGEHRRALAAGLSVPGERHLPSP